MRNKSDHDLSDYDDAAIMHLLESSGVCVMVVNAIHYPNKIDIDDEEFDDWKKPEFAGIRRAAAEAYLYGIYIRSLTSKGDDETR